MIAPDISSQELFSLKWSGYIPHDPTPKQRLFLSLPSEEALYGGAAGGGKSDALLMGALQWVDHPAYNAILIRRTFTDLRLPDALIDRSHQWLSNTDARWNGSSHQWRFPSGATISFGYLDNENDKYRYQSAQFAYVGVDEVTQIPLDWVLYLHSRLRRLTGVPFPPRIRYATNPGGHSHIEIKERFGIRPIQLNGETLYLGSYKDRPYIPAWIKDNPYIRQEEYMKRLYNLPLIERERLLAGDWSISEEGMFSPGWLQRYAIRGDYYILGNPLSGEQLHKIRDLEVFQVCDTATSTKDIHPSQERPRSHTVIGTFARSLSNNDLLILNVDRFQDRVPNVINRIERNYKYWRPNYVGIENAHAGIAVLQECERRGMAVIALNPGSNDKVTRARQAMTRMERGKIWAPQHAPWLDSFESEIFSWTGDPREPDDQVDVLAYAAREVEARAFEYEREGYMPPITGEGMPMLGGPTDDY